MSVSGRSAAKAVAVLTGCMRPSSAFRAKDFGVVERDARTMARKVCGCPASADPRPRQAIGRRSRVTNR